jgi:membrane-associated protease RseP (regulator of RpoE activity)
VNLDTVALLALLVLLSLFLVKRRQQLQTFSFLRIFYFCMYRTRLGMAAMERWARRNEAWLQKSGHVMIPACFIGMIAMIEELIRGVIMLLQNTDALTVGVVLPIQAKGVFYVPFFYWIIAVLFIMVVHEFSHGLIARAHKVRVKSTGFACLGALVPVVPGAFVEIDEKHLAKQPKYTQLSIFAAGPFVNLVFGALFWAAFLLMQPAADALFVADGMAITQVAEGSPAAITGLAVGELITQIDGIAVRSVKDFEQAFSAKKPGDAISITTATGSKEAALAGTEKSYLGVQVEEAKHLKESVIANHGWLLPRAFVWLVDLVFWLFVLNLGVGLFNLVPLGPIDGGRMFHTALQHVVHHRHARTVWHATSVVMLAIIVGSIVSAFV